MENNFFLNKNFGLTASEYSALQETMLEQNFILNSNGYTMNISTDFNNLIIHWEKFRKNESCRQIIPAYDPQFEQINADNGFWIGIFDEDYNCVALVASRLREVENSLYDSLMDKTFIMGPCPPDGATCSVNAQLNGMCGPITFIGALYISKKLRASRLVNILSEAVIRVGYSRWKPLWQVCIISTKDLPLAFGAYGFQTVFGEIRFYDPRWQISPRCAILGMSSVEVRQRFLKTKKDLDYKKYLPKQSMFSDDVKEFPAA